ncbi:MAG: hypothetical protein OEW77_08965, partial [Gemmatimonadota bacterium]|nr:hypothetical protein [Gemmatimonadota bacterium]
MTAPDPTHALSIRPAGVTASAVVAILGSLATVMLAGSLLRTTEGIEEQLPGGRVVALAMAGTLLLSAFAGIATAVGLWRMRHWARLGMLIIAGSLVILCTASALVVAAIPIPQVGGAAAGSAAGVRAILLAFYAVPGAIGIWWLVYFTRERTKACFAASGPIAPPGVPLTVALIGWSCVVGGVLCLAVPFTGAPAYLLGAVLVGWAARAFFLALAAVQLVIGRGLLRLEERARVAGAWFFGVGSLYGVAGLVVPGSRADALAYARSIAAAVDSAGTLDIAAL